METHRIKWSGPWRKEYALGHPVTHARDGVCGGVHVSVRLNRFSQDSGRVWQLAIRTEGAPKRDIYYNPNCIYAEGLSDAKTKAAHRACSVLDMAGVPVRCPFCGFNT